MTKPQTVNLTTLAPPIKRAVWQAIQAEAPALADLLTSEPLQELVRTFDGQVHAHLEDLPQAALEAL